MRRTQLCISLQQTELKNSHDDAVSVAAADATKKADAALAGAKTYTDGLNTAMDGRVKVVEKALTWKPIDDTGASADT